MASRLAGFERKVDSEHADVDAVLNMAPTDHKTKVVPPAEEPEEMPLPSDPKVIFLGGLRSGGCGEVAGWPARGTDLEDISASTGTAGYATEARGRRTPESTLAQVRSNQESTDRSTISGSTLADRCRSGAKKAGSTPTIRVVGSNGLWDELIIAKPESDLGFCLIL